MKAKINIEVLQPRQWLHQAETIEKERMGMKLKEAMEQANPGKASLCV